MTAIRAAQSAIIEIIAGANAVGVGATSSDGTEGGVAVDGKGEGRHDRCGGKGCRALLRRQQLRIQELEQRVLGSVGVPAESVGGGHQDEGRWNEEHSRDVEGDIFNGGRHDVIAFSGNSGAGQGRRSWKITI